MERYGSTKVKINRKPMLGKYGSITHLDDELKDYGSVRLPNTSVKKT